MEMIPLYSPHDLPTRAMESIHMERIRSYLLKCTLQARNNIFKITRQVLDVLCKFIKKLEQYQKSQVETINEAYQYYVQCVQKLPKFLMDIIFYNKWIYPAEKYLFYILNVLGNMNSTHRVSLQGKTKPQKEWLSSQYHEDPLTLIGVIQFFYEIYAKKAKNAKKTHSQCLNAKELRDQIQHFLNIALRAEVLLAFLHLKKKDPKFKKFWKHNKKDVLQNEEYGMVFYFYEMYKDEITKVLPHHHPLP